MQEDLIQAVHVQIVWMSTEADWNKPRMWRGLSLHYRAEMNYTQIRRFFSCLYDRKEVASCFKKGGGERADKSRARVQLEKIGRSLFHMWYYLMVVDCNSVLSRGREKIHTDSTLRRVMTVSHSISWKDSLSQKKVKELGLTVKHFIPNSLFIETIRMWRQEIWLIQLYM